MAEKSCLCPVGTTTTYREHFQQFEKTKQPRLEKLQKPCDIGLISGHFINNLDMNRQLIRSKAWPGITDAEEYEHFLKRLDCCKKDIFSLYFKCPAADKSVIDQMLKNLSKTAYQLVFSPNLFIPRTEKRRFAKFLNQPVAMKYQETTYNTYFSRIKELEQFRDVLQGLVLKNKNDQLKNICNKVQRCGRTTYYCDISELGKLYAKPTIPGPIDRYTLRRI